MTLQVAQEYAHRQEEDAAGPQILDAGEKCGGTRSVRLFDEFADLPAVLARAQGLIVAEGGSFSGDAHAGKFSGASPVGPVEGRYTVQGASIRITITNKPMLAPCGAIEARIRSTTF